MSWMEEIDEPHAAKYGPGCGDCDWTGWVHEQAGRSKIVRRVPCDGCGEATLPSSEDSGENR